MTSEKSFIFQGLEGLIFFNQGLAVIDFSAPFANFTSKRLLSKG